MKLDLNEIVLHLGKRIRYDIDEPPIEDIESGLRGIEPVKGQVVFTNSGKHVVVRGRFSTKVEVECARCLRNYAMDIDLPIEEELELAGHAPEIDEDFVEDELPDEEKGLLFVDNILDLTELLRQCIVVAVPIKPLCDDMCKGLCPRCGINLNEGQCECPPEVENQAFAALASLLKDEDEDSGR